MTQKWRLAWVPTLLFVVSIAVISLAQQVEAATYRRGPSGERVWTAQTKLRNWGYYNGAVDGIYGSQTAQAVKYFQRKDGLTADDIVGPATLKVSDISSEGGGGSGQQNSIVLLARMISAEVRGESYSDQVAVGAVTLNRAGYLSFPNIIAGAMYQPGAFTCMVDRQFNEPVTDPTYRTAQGTFNGADPSNGTIYYSNPDTATSTWIWSHLLIKTIGKHRSCA